jgi:hypothetical protein
MAPDCYRRKTKISANKAISNKKRYFDIFRDQFLATKEARKEEFVMRQNF